MSYTLRYAFFDNWIVWRAYDGNGNPVDERPGSLLAITVKDARSDCKRCAGTGLMSGFMICYCGLRIRSNCGSRDPHHVPPPGY